MHTAEDAANEAPVQTARPNRTRGFVDPASVVLHSPRVSRFTLTPHQSLYTSPHRGRSWKSWRSSAACRCASSRLQWYPLNFEPYTSTLGPRP